MKKSYYFVLLVMFSFMLTSCKDESDNNYLDKNIIVEELNSYVADVLINEHLISFIEDNYSNLNLTVDTYDEAVNDAKEALFALEKETLISLFSLDELFLDEIDDINRLYPYVAINHLDLTSIIYKFNLDLLNESYKISLNDDNPYYLFNSELLPLTSNLEIKEDLLSNLVKTDNKYFLYIVSKTYTYKISLTEVKDDMPYVINPNIYSDFVEDVVIMFEALGGVLEISGDTFRSQDYQIENGKLIIDKTFLQDLFTDGRKDFYFAVNISLGSDIYIEMIRIIAKD